MSPELAEKLAKAVDSMPGFPHSVQRILTLTRDMNCSPKELIQTRLIKARQGYQNNAEWIF